MRIIINLLDCGLGNNGGSQTLIRMAEALKVLGNDVIIATNKNNFTWFKISEGLVKFYQKHTELPECDIIMATACSTVRSTISYDKVPLSKKYYWIRAHETWAMGEQDLFRGYASGLKLLANSEWQRELIYTSTGVTSKILYSGIPIEEIEKLSKPKRDEKMVIGALFSTKERKRFPDVYDICKEVYKKGFVKEFAFFGDSDFPHLMNRSHNLPIKYFKQPSFEEKIKMMSECDIWLSTSINEGLHIPPAEAGLCGCHLVARNFRASGVSDYALEGLTASTFLENEEAVKKIVEYNEWPSSKKENNESKEILKRIIKEKLGTVEVNAHRLLNIIGE